MKNEDLYKKYMSERVEPMLDLINHGRKLGFDVLKVKDPYGRDVSENGRVGKLLGVEIVTIEDHD